MNTLTLLDLPEEMILYILSKLETRELIICGQVCCKLYDLSQDSTLDGRHILKEIKSNDLEKLFKDCCFQGRQGSVKFLVNYFVKGHPPCDFQSLWGLGFIEATKGGHTNLMKLMMSYGAGIEVAEKALECTTEKKVRKFLLENFDFSDYTIKKYD